MSDDEEAQSVPPTKKPKSTQGRGAAAPVTKPTSKTKGKAKVDAQPLEVEEPMTIDEVEVIQSEQLPQRATRTSKPQGKATSATTKPSSPPAVAVGEIDRLRREAERVRKQLADAHEREQKLVGQLEEVFRIRNTDAEEALAQEREVFDAKITAQELLLAEQAKLITASNSGMLHFLSREDADKEKKEVEDNVLHWKQVAAQKDEEIVAQTQQIQQLETELKAEIERAKTLAARNPLPSASRNNGTAKVDGSGATAVICLYETMTNVLVLNTTIKPSEFHGKEEHEFDCIYSVSNPSDDLLQALHFTLRDMWQPLDDSDELIRKIEYQPKDLDKELPELVDKLDFFRDPFIFAHDQLHVFLRTLSERFQPVASQDEEQEEEDELAES
ncbi:unnamed protein product [Somion occarium]